MKVSARMIAIVALAVPIAIEPSVSPACTGITLRPADGSIIFARTLEFALDLQSNIIVVPRGKENPPGAERMGGASTGGADKGRAEARACVPVCGGRDAQQ
jgi:penicillin V acylase-like amidase (Ntn superfamily)